VYDAGRDRMLVFAGYYGVCDAIWSLDLKAAPGWVSTRVANGPAGTTYGQSAIYDSRRDRMLVFGGSDGVSFLNSLVSLAPAAPSWQPMTASGTPPTPRAGQAAVFDRSRDRMIVFGGYNSTEGFLNDVWVLSLAGTPAWTRMTPAGTPPPGRDFSAVVLDAADDRILVFGGNVGAGFANDLWQLSLGNTPTWTRLDPSGTAPPARGEAAAAFDSIGGTMFIIAGYDGGTRNDVWKWSGAGGGAWAEVHPAGGVLSPRHSMPAMFDPVRRRIVVYGGRNEATATQRADAPWLDLTVNPPRWYVDPPAAPSPRYGPSLVYDPNGDRVILFGGRDDFNYSDTYGQYWEMNFRAAPEWKRHQGVGSVLPLTRFGHVAYCDAPRNRMLVFGGDYFQAGPAFFSLSLANDSLWTLVDPPGPGPATRSYPGMAYDSRRDRLLFFGGNTGAGLSNQVWALSLSGTPSWQLLGPTGTPPTPRFGSSAVYDPAKDRLLVFGGYPANTNTSAPDQLWELSLTPAPTWRAIPDNTLPGLWPSPRSFLSAQFDPYSKRMVFYSGISAITVYDEVMALSTAPADSWQTLAPSGSRPPSRFAGATAFDTRRDRMMIFGGSQYGGPLFSDAWFLNWQGTVTPTALSCESVDATPDRIRVVWYAAGASGIARVVRADRGGPWVRIGEGSFDGTGRLVFEDREIEPGVAYRYAVEIDGEEGVRAEVAVRAGNRPTTVLGGFLQNPAEGAPVLGYSLESPEPATLELFDLAGRPVWKRELDARVAGPGRIVVDAQVALRPGVYVVRLKQGEVIRTARGIVLR
jgi:hypothetical protein